MGGKADLVSLDSGNLLVLRDLVSDLLVPLFQSTLGDGFSLDGQSSCFQRIGEMTDHLGDFDSFGYIVSTASYPCDWATEP